MHSYASDTQVPTSARDQMLTRDLEETRVGLYFLKAIGHKYTTMLNN